MQRAAVPTKFNLLKEEDSSHWRRCCCHNNDRSLRLPLDGRGVLALSSITACGGWWTLQIPERERFSTGALPMRFYTLNNNPRSMVKRVKSYTVLSPHRLVVLFFC